MGREGGRNPRLGQSQVILEQECGSQHHQRRLHGFLLLADMMVEQQQLQKLQIKSKVTSLFQVVHKTPNTLRVQ